MKYLLLFLFVCIYLLPAAGQTIGLKYNSGFLSLEQSDYETGAGVVIGINDFSKKIEVLLSMDFNKSNTFVKDETQSVYARNYLTITGLYVLSIREKMKFKPGISISHENIKMKQSGVYSSWYKNTFSKYLGIGFMANLQFQEIFALPINFDIFITPAWLKNIYMEDPPFKTYYANHNDLFALNVQVGLAYVVNFSK